MRKLLLLLIIVVLITSGGCATLRGMGHDCENLGRGLEKTFANEKDNK
jgi:predicted small secreted protein